MIVSRNRSSSFGSPLEFTLWAANVLLMATVVLKQKLWRPPRHPLEAAVDADWS